MSTLREFWERYADAEEALRAWYEDATVASWNSPHDVKKQYANASILSDSRVCFNIRGNHYRLIVRISYEHQRVLIKWIGTHAEYDRIDANKIGMPEGE